MSKNENMKHTSKRGHGPMGGGPMGGMPPEKPKDFKGTMKKLLTYIKPFIPQIIVVFMFAIVGVIISIRGPKILGKAITKLYEGLVGKATGGSIDFDFIAETLLVLLLIYAASSLFSFIGGYIMSGIAQKVSYNLRKEISEKINRLPLKYFDKMTHGEVLSRVTNDVDTVSQTLNQSLFQMITSFTTLIGVLVMMLTISWLMTIIAVMIVPISVIFISAIVKQSQKYFRSQQESLGKVNGHVEEIFSGHNIMKAFNGEEKAVDEFNSINDTLHKAAWKSQFLSGMMPPVMGFIGNIGYVFVTILGGWLTIKGTIKVGDIVSFVQYVRNFQQPIGQAAQIANILQSTAAAAERVFAFLAEEEEPKDVEKPASTQAVTGEVKFEKVHFGYNPENIVINDFSAVIKPGQRVAIVGPTGAGKTTIVKLLMRFYDLNSGDIFIDGINSKDFRRNDLRDMFGMVLQDTWLFNGTIMENIRYGRLDATDEEVIQAAKAAHAHHFIKTQPDGYNMVLNEEANNVSQGQKQLLTIARAILSDPKILILDEATSSVDTRTEVLIQKALENLMKNRTSFIIAHRLSTIRDADMILVMKNGDIVEQGTHEELLKAGGFYAQLYNSQFEEAEAS